MQNPITALIRPFVGSGIGNHFPFRQIYQLYVHISEGKSSVHSTIYGFNMDLEPGKLIDDTIRFRGAWEEDISKIISESLHPGDVFIDIGANIGYYSLLASTRVGTTGTVIAFEPSSSNYQKLIQNITINHYANITTHKLGVSDVVASFEIRYDDSNPGASSMVSSVRNNGFPSETVEVVQLDEFLQKEPRIDFIKMDIEGFEYEAILGMQNILKKFPTIKLLFEFSPLLYGYKIEEENSEEYSIRVLQKLQDIGFHLHHIHHDATYTCIEDLKTYYDTVQSQGGQSDILCMK